MRYDERRNADLFFADLMGAGAPRRRRPPARVPRTPIQQTLAEPARLFDRVAHGGHDASEVFFEGELEESGTTGPWTAVALPRSATPLHALHDGDLVVQRAFGEGWLAAVRVVGEDVEAHALYGGDGRIRPDTLVLRSTRAYRAPAAPVEDVPLATSVVASPRRKGGQWMTDANAGFLGRIPERTSSKKGSEILASVMRPEQVGKKDWRDPGAKEARDEVIFKEIVRGNIPDYLRQGRMVTVEFTGKDDKPHALVYQVMRDYLAVGSNDDFVIIPLTPPVAQRIADKFGCILPTALMVDQIFDTARAKVSAITRGYYMTGGVDKKTGKTLPTYDPTKDTRLVTHKFDAELSRQDRQISTAAFLEHDMAIKAQLDSMSVLRSMGMLLVAGHKKDLVIAKTPNAKQLQFYGMYTVTTGKDGTKVGTPIQAERGRGFPVSSHEPSYVDYSHGVRLVAGTMVADGNEMSAAEVLKHEIYGWALSKEGPISSPRVPGAVTSATGESISVPDLEAYAGPMSEVAPDARKQPGAAPPVQEIKSRPSLEIVGQTGKPLAGARWAVFQNDAVFTGAVTADGSTGPIDAVDGKFDPLQPFFLDVEGCVCSIVSGAALLVQDPSVEYGGQFLDWRLADSTDFSKRSAFWEDYAKARKLRGPLDVFRFLQHDHVMRRPVQMLARHNRATFEARPLAIRVGPIVRFVDAGRALIWLELETPGLVRVTFGKATAQRELPATGQTPAKTQERCATSVRVGGRHFALVWLDGLEPDTAYQYTIALGPQPPIGTLPMAPKDFTDEVFPRHPTYGGRASLAVDLKQASLRESDWLFFRTFPRGGDTLRFAHGSCRKYPNDKDQQDQTPGPDMLDVFGTSWLGKKSWADWPRFFLHTGDQIYADDVGVAMAGTILRHRVAAAVPGPAPAAGHDVAHGAWAGRFGFRYGPRMTATTRLDLDRLRELRPEVVGPSSHDLEYFIKRALRARAQAEYARTRSALPINPSLRVMNHLLWDIPDAFDEVPHVNRKLGLLVPQTYRVEGPPAQEFRIEHPAAGDTAGVHAADFAEYAALYEQAWSVTGARRVLAHLPSFMIFDDHEVTDDWNADPVWLKVIHAKSDPLRFWPTTMTDALCAYWVYQGWGNLSPEAAAADPRVQILERCRKDGRDALPELRRLVAERAIDVTAAGADFSKKLSWNYELPTGSVPFLAVDLRTDRDVNGTGGMSPSRLKWIEQTLTATKSPVAFLVLPVPYLMPDPLLFAFRHPGFVARLAGARSTISFKHGSDIEHPAGNPVWDQIKGLLVKLQQSSTIKTLVVISGDIHFSCNLDGQLAGSMKAPRMLQLVSSGLRQRITDTKKGQLNGSYRGWLNTISRAQGVDVHRGMRITLGGLEGPGGKLSNFLFETSMAIVDMTLKPWGPKSATTLVPLVEQRHLASERNTLVDYRFRHMTQGDGSAVMRLKDPGFAHPASPKDYPAAPAGIGIVHELVEDSSPSGDTSPGEDPGSFDPGQSIVVDGQTIGTCTDGAAWYTARRAVLAEQQSAFVKDQVPVPDGLADLIATADTRIKTMGTKGSQPLADADVEAMLDWFDRYVAVLQACDEAMDRIAADRFRAAQAATDKLKAQVLKLQPQLRDIQRSAFRAGKRSTLKEAAGTFATVLDSVLVSDKWLLDAATKMDDIRSLGTTLRTQKALHDVKTPWNELMRKTTDAKVAKMISVADGLNKALSAWQFVDASFTLLSGGKTASDTGSAGVSLTTTAASAGATLLGASGFFTLYTNLYIGPMVSRILGQIDQLKDMVSKYQNHPLIQLGKLDLVDWDLEPGGREMYDFMHAVMNMRSGDDIKAIPKAVRAYFDKYRRDFDAGTPKRHGVHLDYADFDDKRHWIFAFRDDIWGMLYGSLAMT